MNEFKIILQFRNIFKIYFLLFKKEVKKLAEILIVEDELSINELIRRNLSLTGHHCTQAFDGLSDCVGYYASQTGRLSGV